MSGADRASLKSCNGWTSIYRDGHFFNYITLASPREPSRQKSHRRGANPDWWSANPPLLLLAWLCFFFTTNWPREIGWYRPNWPKQQQVADFVAGASSQGIYHPRSEAEGASNGQKSPKLLDLTVENDDGVRGLEECSIIISLSISQNDQGLQLLQAFTPSNPHIWDQLVTAWLIAAVYFWILLHCTAYRGSN